jgi:hypothetical protein
MKAFTLITVFQEFPNAEVVIETDKQLLPNAEYTFEVDKDANRIVLRPSSRR